MSQLYMIQGKHQHSQYNGMIVRAVHWSWLHDDVAHTDTELFETQPVLLGRDGKAIYWKQEHLFPIRDFPAETLNETTFQPMNAYFQGYQDGPMG